MKKYETKKVVIEVELDYNTRPEDAIQSINKTWWGISARLISPDKEGKQSFDKQGLKDKIKCTVCNGDGYTAEHVCDGTESMCSSSCPQQFQCEACRATGINLSLNIMQIIDTLEPKVLSEKLIRKIELHIETTEECSENFNIPDYVKSLLSQDIKLYKEIISYMKGEQK